MSENPIIHLAIPCNDLDEAEHFYVDVLGCVRGRRYADRISIDFWGAQIVCHLSPEETAKTVRLYPRHFGLTFRSEEDFDNLYRQARNAGVNIVKPVFIRFAALREAHKTFFICDPSNNVIEAKFYFHQDCNY